MAINSKSALIEWCRAFKAENEGNLLIPSLFELLNKYVEDISAEVDADPEDPYFFKIIDLLRHIAEGNPKTPNGQDSIAQLCGQFSLPSGLEAITKDINRGIKQKVQSAPPQLNIKPSLNEMLYPAYKDNPVEIKLSKLSNELKKVSVSYGISNERNNLAIVTKQLKTCLSDKLDNIPLKEVNKVITDAENHLRYVAYIQNIESKITNLETHINSLSKPSDTLKKDVEALRHEVNVFRKKPLQDKIRAVKPFNDMMVNSLNDMDDKMRGRVHREVLKPLIKHALAACTIVGLPGVLVSLVHRAATGKFMFFESKQKHLKEIHESLKNAPVLDAPTNKI